VHIIGAISLALHKLSGFAFVDDMDLCVTHPSNKGSEVAKHMQGSVSTWEGLLCATKGALVPEKCFWYLIDFEHRNGKWDYLPMTRLPGTLFVHSATGTHMIISCLKLSEARCTLGV